MSGGTGDEAEGCLDFFRKPRGKLLFVLIEIVAGLGREDKAWRNRQSLSCHFSKSCTLAAEKLAAARRAASRAAAKRIDPLCHFKPFPPRKLSRKNHGAIKSHGD